MNGLIKVTTKGDTQVVSARDLHRELKVKTRFSLWVKQNFKHFRESIDFTSVVVNTEVQNNGGIQIRELQDYALSVEMAKHIAMMAGTEKGVRNQRLLHQGRKSMEQSRNGDEEGFGNCKR